VASKLGRRAESAAARKEREQREAEQQKADLELGERIRYLRKEILGFHRQQDFADRLGVTRGAVGNWEIGTGVKRTTLQLISEEFNVSLVWLSTGAGAPITKSGIDAQLELLPPEDYETLYDLFQAMIDSRRRKAEERKRAEAEKKRKK
jgi:transcriptional regulator with XRE-family HTH domain